jgi:hypothetical protein
LPDVRGTDQRPAAAFLAVDGRFSADCFLAAPPFPPRVSARLSGAAAADGCPGFFDFSASLAANSAMSTVRA